MKPSRFMLGLFLLLTCSLALAGQDELVQAIIHGADAKQVAGMLQQGADANKPEAFGRTPLMAAAYAGKPEVVKLLLTKGADVNAQGFMGVTALVNATNGNYPDIVKLLLDQGATPTVKVLGMPLLQLAAAQCDPEIIQMLLEKGAEVNATDTKGNTALTAAAESGNLGAARILLKGGAIRTLKNSDGKTALDMAKQNKHREIVKLLDSKS